jgi:thiol-disulfide isomerase/thioredoxin
LSIKATLKARQRRRRILWVSAVVALVALLVVVYFAATLNASNQLTAYIGKPVPAAVLSELTGVSDSTLSAIGAPPGVNPPVPVSGAPLTSNGKPVVLYIGAEFCPYCAVERWAMVVALSRFGTFHGLQLMLSGDLPEPNPDTPTFTFTNTTFTSNYIVFQSVEEYDRSDNPLQSLTPAQSSLLSQYDTCQSTGQSGGIPFIDIANQYVVNCGAQFVLSNQPGPAPNIVGMNWTQIASQLNDPSSGVAQRIDGAANYLISAICKATGGAPASVCSQSYATEPLAYLPPPSSPQTPLAVPTLGADQPRTG